MAHKDILAAFPVTCYGVSENDGSPLKFPVTASVTINNKGERVVGCCYLARNWQISGPRKGECLAAPWGRRACPHLVPITQEEVSPSEPQLDENDPIPFQSQQPPKPHLPS